ncbi:unnamed protein product [Pieris brassicae]|uniref:Uncharacterized protein n=1 Tax=Pieris brassicae TaxID=7116 RepID=A0A9P0WSM7_PIEBR|nr:unnamed protein product [Pieris brassicae]
MGTYIIFDNANQGIPIIQVTQSQQLCRGISSHRVSCVSAALPRITCISDEANEGEARRKSAFSHLGVSPRSSFALEQPDACTIRSVYM